MKQLFFFSIILISNCSKGQTISNQEGKFQIGGTLGLNANFSDIPSNEFWGSLSKNPSVGGILRYKLHEKSKNNWTTLFFFRSNLTYSTHQNIRNSVTHEFSKIGVSKVKSNSILLSPYIEYHWERSYTQTPNKWYSIFSPYIYLGFPITHTSHNLYQTENQPLGNLKVEKSTILNGHIGLGLRLLRYNNLELSIEEGCRFSFTKNISGVVYANNLATRKDFFYNGNIILTYRLSKKNKVIEIDTDGDGILDRDDKCPTQFGKKKNQGCCPCTKCLPTK